jgi:hypothetical protein
VDGVFHGLLYPYGKLLFQLLKIKSAMHAKMQRTVTTYKLNDDLKDREEFEQ